MVIGIIGALKEETETLIAQLKNVKVETKNDITLTRGSLFSHEVIVNTCGVGKVFSALSAATLVERCSPDMLINIGVAGGVKPLKQGDIVISSFTVQHDYSAEADGLPRGQIQGFDSPFIDCDGAVASKLLAAARSLGIHAELGIIASGDCFVSDSTLVSTLKTLFNASAFDMESASIAQVAKTVKVPFCALRSISDNGEDEAVESFYTFLPKAARRSVDTLTKFVENLE